MNFVRLRCWWNGCEQHPQDPSPVEEVRCQWCGDLLQYYDLIKISGMRYRLFLLFEKYRMRFTPKHKCKLCGLRGMHAADCEGGIPF